jgi:hypothetical protein
MKKVILASVIALTSTIATAEVWSGTGKSYGINFDELSEYQVEVNVEAVSATQQDIDIKITDTAGEIISTDRCTSVANEDGSWTKQCLNGSSVGSMLDYNLGMDYYTAKDGKAYATNIVIDSDSQMRLFRTELASSGLATRFFVETLNKQ